MIHKPGKDPELCTNYCPIFLINADCKILAKVLANRLNYVLAELIHPDQVEFIRNTVSYNNIRLSLNIVKLFRNKMAPAAALAVDTEKYLPPPRMKIFLCFLPDTPPRLFSPQKQVESL